MAINPIPPISPQTGRFLFGPAFWPQFEALVAEFWSAIEGEDWEAAEQLILRIFQMTAGRTAALAIYETCAAELAAGLTAAWGLTVTVTEGIVAVVTAPESGFIICVAIVGLWAIGGGSTPVYAETGGGAIVWRPQPIRQPKDFLEALRKLVERPKQARGLFKAPQAKPRSAAAQKKAAEIVLRHIGRGTRL